MLDPGNFKEAHGAFTEGRMRCEAGGVSAKDMITWQVSVNRKEGCEDGLFVTNGAAEGTAQIWFW